MSSKSRKYRSAITIIGIILEELIKVETQGLPKALIYKKVGLKTPIGERYIEQLINAGYVTLEKEKWGDLREKHIIKISKLGIKRFEWIIQLNNELEGK